MKILFIVGPFPLLSETFILNQITGLIDRGHEVHIYATQKGNNSEIRHPAVNRYDLFKCTRFRKKISKGRIRRRLDLLLLACEVGVIQPKMLCHALQSRTHGLPISQLALLHDARSLMNCPCYDIIHCHFGFHGNRGMLLREIGALQGKLITTFHGVDLTVALKKGGHKLYNHLFTQGDLFLPISNRWRKRLIDLGCDKSKIQVHHMGIDCRRFTFKMRTPEQDGSFKIVSVARLVEKKGLEYGIKAVARLKEEYPNINYTIIGDGPLRGELTQLIQKLNVSDVVRMVGWKAQHQVVDILENATIFLAPSVTAKNGDQEGIPVVLMEAMAMGLPVISTQHSGIPELVKDGGSGYLTPERDADAIFEKMKMLVHDPRLWAQMRKEGRNIVERYYNIDCLNDNLLEIYKNLTYD